MIALALAACAGLGVHLLYSGITAPASRSARPRRTHRVALDAWLAQAGLEVRPSEFAAALALCAVGGTALGAALFGGLLPGLVAGAFAATSPIAFHRRRREQRRAQASEAWPSIVEELRVLTGAAGRSIPQALFESGQRAPAELRDAFEAARREWAVSTDFAASLDVLTSRVADPTADVVCETLLAAYDVGGTNLDTRLGVLAEDRLVDVQHRKDARARQAGVRFARSFVLLVPAGMVGVGFVIGNGRAAYQTPTGQLATAVAIGFVGLCWLWAGRIMRLPVEARVFDRARR